MKRIALFLMAAGLISMAACKSAPKQEATVEPAATEAVVDSTVAATDSTVADVPAEPAEGTVNE